MATCKDCVHVDVCEDLTRYKLSPKRAENYCRFYAKKVKRANTLKIVPVLWSYLSNRARKSFILIRQGAYMNQQ